ncbi:MAG: AtpZ/AtpI family protein [Gemmatimonadetes bacterium]|nr:AtpZ/AtpI family protein [Gemmatimonadota bacterium]
MPRRRRGTTNLNRYARHVHLGAQFALIMLLFILGGSKLDDRFGNHGIFTLLGTFVGAGIGTYVLYREVERSGKQDSARPSGDDAGSPPRDRDSDRTDRGS